MVSIRPAAGPCGSGPGWEGKGRVSQQKITNTENNFFIVASNASEYQINAPECRTKLSEDIPNSSQYHLPLHVLPYTASIPRRVRSLRESSDRCRSRPG